MDTWRRLRLAGGAFVLVVVTGTVGYTLFGLSALDALYQAVITITTVGFRELKPFSTAEKVFTIALIFAGTGTAFYTFTMIVEAVVSGELGELMGRRKMDKKIAALKGHVILCGAGRVGRTIATELTDAGRDVVLIDIDPDRITQVGVLAVRGDATRDDTLRAAGIERASGLVAALADDADNLFVTLSGRALRPDLFIVARAREMGSIGKLERAGADRVVNPQELGGQRMASFIVRPNVAEFVDVYMHDQALDLELQEVAITDGSPLDGRTLRDLRLRETTGAIVFAIRDADGKFTTNPDVTYPLRSGTVVIAIGTEPQLARLHKVVEGSPPR